MKSVYFIPTNRNIERCLNSYVKEVIFAKEKYGLDIPIVITETNNKAFVKDNSRAIQKLQQQYPFLKLVHMTVELQKRYFDTLFGHKYRKIKEIFQSEKKDYGNAMNKLFIMTSSLGADAFHRRDSDTCLVFDEFENALRLYPIEIELNCLGKQLSSVSSSLNLADIGEEPGNREIWVVGSNYHGEWNLDLKEFAQKSTGTFYRIFELLGYSKESMGWIENQHYRFEEELDQTEGFSLAAKVNDEMLPDCGNHAVYKLHEFLPCLPGNNTIAGDLFSVEAASALGIPVIHHERKVFHEYHSERFDMSVKLNYWLGMAKFADYYNLYIKILNDLHKDFRAGINCMNSETVGFIKDRVSDLRFSSRKERTERLEMLAREVLIGFGGNYIDIGGYILENKDAIIAEADNEYVFHSELIQEWASLIERAKNIYLPDIIALD